ELSERRIRQLQPQAATPRKGVGMVLDLLTDGLPWGPMVDGELVQRPTVDSLSAGVGADKPLLLGATDDEFTMVAEREGSKLKWVPGPFLLLPFLRRRAVRRAYLAGNTEQRAKGSVALVGRFIS